MTRDDYIITCDRCGVENIILDKKKASVCAGCVSPFTTEVLRKIRKLNVKIINYKDWLRL